jgi:hypothetical protein
MFQKSKTFIDFHPIYIHSTRKRQQLIVRSSLSFQIGNTINWIKLFGGISNIIEKVIHKRLDRPSQTSLPVLENPIITPHHSEERNFESNGINVFAIIALTAFTSIAIIKGINFLHNSNHAEKSVSLHDLNDLEISTVFEKAQENVRILCTEKTGIISMCANFLICNFEIITICFIVISLSALSTILYLIFLKYKRDKMDNGNTIDVVHNDVPEPKSFIGK